MIPLVILYTKRNKMYDVFNKRKIKENLKHARDALEKQQRSFHRQDFMYGAPHHSRAMSHQYPVNRLSQSYSKLSGDYNHKEGTMDSSHPRKHQSDLLPQIRMHEDNPRSFEEVEMKSTAISCQERQSVRDGPLRNYGSSPEPMYDTPVIDEKEYPSKLINAPVRNQAREDLSKE
jgi:hypothetical protein